MSDSKKNKNSKQKKQLKMYLMLILFLALAILATVMTFTAYYVGTGKIAFNVPNIDTAANSCEEKINREFGKELLNMSYDHGSSRYEENRRRYVIWYRITTREVDRNDIAEIKDKMAKCEIWEFLGYVSGYEAYDL